jgi:hypothetical protein
MGQKLFEKEKDKIVQEGLASLNDEFEKKMNKL